MRDALVGAREIRIAKYRAHVPRSAVRIEGERAGGRDVVEEVAVRLGLVEEELVDDESFTGDLNRRFERLVERHRPVAAQGLGPASDGPGNADRQAAVARRGE